MISADERRQAALALLEAERTCRPIQQVSRTWPAMELEDSYAVQSIWAAERIQRGALLVQVETVASKPTRAEPHHPSNQKTETYEGDTVNSQRRYFLQGALMLAAGSSLAQEDPARYPARPIRMILQGAGGASDQTARNIQAVMQKILGQPLVIESRSGASGNIAMEVTAQSPADGHTVFLSTVAPAVNPALFKSMKVRPERDLRGVSLLAFTPTVLVAHPSFEANSINELVALAKAKPAQIPFASSGTGSVTRMQMEMFAREAGIQLVHVPYKGGAASAINDVLGGQVPMTLTTMPVVLALLRAGKLKALAVTSAERQPLLPDVPTMAEQGFRSSISQQWQAMFVPAATPPAIIEKLHAAVVAAVNDPRVRKTFADAGQTPVFSKSPAEMDEFLRAETKRWGEIVKQLGITSD